MAEWPKEYTLKTNELLAQDCLTIVGLSISGRLKVDLLEQKHRELVRLWPILGGELVTKQTPYSMTTGSKVDFKHRTIDAKLKDVTPVDFELSKEEREGTNPLTRPYRSGNGVLTVDDLCFDAVAALNATVGSLFAIRVTLLQDATILAFKFAHFFVDGQGCYDIIEQYNNLLWGKSMPKAVPPPGIHTKLSSLIAGEDTLPLASPAKGGWEYMRNWLGVGTAGWIQLIFQAIVNDYSPMVGWGEPGIEKHVYLPPMFIEQLQKSCQTEIDTARPSGEDTKLSKMDVVNAWWLKRTYANLRDSIVLNMGYAFNFSDRIPVDPSEKYFQGHYYGLYVPMDTVGDMKKLSIAQIALKIRRNVILAKQPSVIRDNLQYMESIQAEKVIPRAKGGDNEGSPLFSAWTRFPFERLNFSPALQENSGTGKFLFNNSRIVLPMNISWKPKLTIFNDATGGIWCQAMQLPSHWKGFADISQDE
ncbi:hypothetical protein TWF694_007997 [Orbilia ellipsospora]|uniref:Uncharacterized protein n=1 Tax=Orbilia ellipsospora TaxID=2528407 RepID=A0AAV9XET8_9PEZI